MSLAVLASGGQNVTSLDYPDADTLLGTETAEIYNPSSQTWQLTGSMALPRVGHTMVLLPDGRGTSLPS